MKFRIYREYGALNSKPIFDAVEKGLYRCGHTISTDPDSIPIIWSVLWQGRMLSNRPIYYSCLKKNLPVIIIEVGNLKRNKTWRISLNHINRLGEFANDFDLDQSRPEKLKLKLKSDQLIRKPEILIATQHQHSLQWEGMPVMSTWVRSQISKIREFSDRKIIVRHHPRSPISIIDPTVTLESPVRIPNTYDNYNIDYNYHCVINHNSGPSVQAAIHGVPIVCDESSLAYDVSNSIDQIENLVFPDRSDWFLKLCHTEWTVDEIESGIPFSRLLSKI